MSSPALAVALLRRATPSQTAAMITAAARAILPNIEHGAALTASALGGAMETAFSGTDAHGAWDWKTAYEACEVAQILFLQKYGSAMMVAGSDPRNVLAMLERVAWLFPTQTRRSQESQSMQQFSTPMGLIDSRDFIAAKRRAEIEPLMPAGIRIGLTGGLDYADHTRVWAVLDKVLAKHPDMILLHGGSPKGAERIASCWARNRKIAQIEFKPDWNRHAKAAPFKRNDQLLQTLPIGIVVFPGSGISDNLADKARKMGIPLMDYR